MSIVSDLTYDEAKRLFTYSAEDGLLRWAVDRGSRTKAGQPISRVDPKKGLICVEVARRGYLAHRIIWLLAHGYWPNGEVEHVNGDRTDNRLENLREVAERKKLQVRTKSTNPLDAGRVRHLFNYEPETGLIWHRIDKKGGPRAGDPAGTPDGNGYLRVQMDGMRTRGHRIAWVHYYGSEPNHDIDHINGDRSDNRIANLRDVPRRVNLENLRKPKGNMFGLLGVRKNKSRFSAQITSKGEHMCLGTYDTPEQAHEAYLKAKRELHEGCTI